jgi:hypothetical protein
MAPLATFYWYSDYLESIRFVPADPVSGTSSLPSTCFRFSEHSGFRTFRFDLMDFDARSPGVGGISATNEGESTVQSWLFAAGYPGRGAPELGHFCRESPFRDTFFVRAQWTGCRVGHN